MEERADKELGNRIRLSWLKSRFCTESYNVAMFILIILLTYRRQIFKMELGKRDDARSISRREHDEFYHGSAPPESNNSTSSLSLLICDFSQ
jgi:hypothetical protein